MNITRNSLLLLCALVSIVLISGCRSHRSRNAKEYELKGKVVSVEKEKRLVTVAHEDIKGYMPGMVMPFTVGENDNWVFEAPLVPGDQITATLVVDGPAAWLESIVIAKESTDTNTTKTAGGLAEPKAGDEVPNYSLTNQDGKIVKISDYRGKALVLTFIYTRCPMPDQCTLMSNNFAIIDQELQKQPDFYAQTHLLSISFDPEYDTPPVMRSYGAGHTGRFTQETFQHWEFATGAKDEVKGLAEFFGMRYYHDTSNGQDQVIHSLRTAVIGPDGKVFKVYRENKWKPSEILDDLKAVLKK